MVKDEELINSLKWYIRHYGKKVVAFSVFETWACGYFHSYPKGVKPIVDKMKILNLVKIKNGSVEIE